MNCRSSMEKLPGSDNRTRRPINTQNRKGKSQNDTENCKPDHDFGLVVSITRFLVSCLSLGRGHDAFVAIRHFAAIGSQSFCDNQAKRWWAKRRSTRPFFCATRPLPRSRLILCNKETHWKEIEMTSLRDSLFANCLLQHLLNLWWLPGSQRTLPVLRFLFGIGPMFQKKANDPCHPFQMIAVLAR